MSVTYEIDVSLSYDNDDVATWEVKLPSPIPWTEGELITVTYPGGEKIMGTLVAVRQMTE